MFLVGTCSALEYLGNMYYFFLLVNPKDESITLDFGTSTSVTTTEFLKFFWIEW